MMCIRVRWQLSNRDEAGTRKGVEQHLECCQACSSFQAQLAQLEGSLTAARLTAPLPNVPRRTTRWPLALTGGLALAVTGLLYAQFGSSSTSSHSGEPDGLSEMAGSADAAQTRLSNTAGEHSDWARAEFISSVRRLGNIEDPLARELAAWRSDGLRGLESIRGLGRDDTSPAL